MVHSRLIKKVELFTNPQINNNLKYRVITIYFIG